MMMVRFILVETHMPFTTAPRMLTFLKRRLLAGQNDQRNRVPIRLVLRQALTTRHIPALGTLGPFSGQPRGLDGSVHPHKVQLEPLKENHLVKSDKAT